MHPNRAFRHTSETHSIALLRERGFGVLAVNAKAGPHLSHVPFLLSEDAAQVDLHLVRSNPIARDLSRGTMPAKLAVQGADSYISPDWYGVEDQVPTWNYVAVHVIGTLGLRPQEELQGLLDRQSAHFERQLAPKPEWTSAKMSDGVMDKMMRAIVPVRLTVQTIDSTWKLGQNKPDDVRASAAHHVAKEGLGADVETLADLMANPPQ